MQNFITGTRTPPTAWGYDEQSIVPRALRCAESQGVYIEVLAASRSGDEAERLRNEIRTSVFDDRRPDTLPVDHFSVDDLSLVSSAPALHWGFDFRPKSLDDCMSAASLAMDQNGLAASQSGESVLWGTSPSVVVLVSCVPVDGGVSILVAAASYDGATAERFRNDVRTITFDS